MTFDDILQFGVRGGFAVAEVLVGATLIILLCAILVLAARRRSAALRHRVWALSIIGVLCLPLFAAVLPEVGPRLHITIPPPRNASELVTNSNVQPVRAAPPFENNRVDGRLEQAARLNEVAISSDSLELEQLVGRNPASPSRRTVGENSSTVSLAAEQADRSLSASKSTRHGAWPLLFGVWVLGVFVTAAFFLRAILLPRALVRRAMPVTHEDVVRLKCQLCGSAGVTADIPLLCSPETSVPLAAGRLHSVIILPSGFSHWPEDRWRVALAHEIAHIRRRDVLWQGIAQLAKVFYWCHPLVWLVDRRMRFEREFACDDAVVRMGERPGGYARQLVEVASSLRKRCRPQCTAVAMASRSRVEHRVRAILHPGLNRMPVARHTGRLLIAVTLMVTLAISLMGPSMKETTADETAVDKTAKAVATDGNSSVKVAETAKIEPSDSTSADADIRTMEVRITDEEGVPLAGAGLYVSVWYVNGYNGERVPKDYLTNSDGMVNVRLPRRIIILRMWPSKSGYVPEFVNFMKGTHDEGKRIPDRYEFQLARGTQLSGTVVDESGEPISGVAVDVRVEVREPAWTVNPKPMISTWLTDEDFNEASALTDKDGRWKINNAPAQAGRKDFEFRLKFTHKDYVSDSKWGELQGQQKLTTRMLRDGSAKIVLSRGVSVTGTIMDSSGNPVTKGLVIWHDDPYGSSAVHETQIDDDGHFETLPLPPGEYPITIVAPGFRPERRMVTVANSMNPLQFAMQPGKRLAIRIIDPDGKPIPNAYVGLRKWRGAQSLYNCCPHPSVPDSRIPRHSDENGLYVWDWAPDDAVTYGVSAKGFSSNTLTLIATEAEHVVELMRPLIASGQVTDAKTGEPIKEFRVVPVTVFRPKFLSASFRNTVTGEDGNYEIKLADDAERDHRYQVRIDADGYRSAISEKTFGFGDGRVTQDFSLEPAAAREGTVVDQDGKPVASAFVVQATPTILPMMDNAELTWDGRKIETSSDGRFQLAATFEPVRVRVTHELGFAEVLRQPDEAIGTIQLQPWAKVSGRLLNDGNPVPDETIGFYPVLKRQLGEPRFQDSYYARTDADGRFEFDRLPPIAGTVRASLGLWRDSALTSSQAVPLDLGPGESRSITLGGNGATLTGRIVATGRDDATLGKHWSLNYLIRRDSGIELPKGFPELSFDPAGPVQISWFLDPNYRNWLATRQNYFVKLSPDGQLRISGVPPGTYDLVLRLYEQPAGCLAGTIGEKVVTIEVTEPDAAAGTKDIGTVEVKCRTGPRVGENMQIYKFTDTAGREQSIKEMSGRYVLMHVWASWCAPCLESMPDIQATINSVSDRPITLVGLNIDKDTSKAKALTRQGGWNWSQNYLGDNSDMARQLAISSVPTYFLIGPDGLLIASATDWSEMKEAFEAALNKTQD